MAQEKDKYSLWLTPNGNTGKMLQDIIGELAEEHRSPYFIPHVTLVANIFAGAGELEDLKARVEECARNISRFVVQLTEYGYLDEEFRSLYLLAQSPELGSMYDRVAQLFPQVEEEHFRQLPHLSVLYGNFSTETKQRMIAAHPLPATEFVVESLDLYLTNNPVEDWRMVQAFPLNRL